MLICFFVSTALPHVRADDANTNNNNLWHLSAAAGAPFIDLGEGFHSSASMGFWMTMSPTQPNGDPILFSQTLVGGTSHSDLKVYWSDLNDRVEATLNSGLITNTNHGTFGFLTIRDQSWHLVVLTYDANNFLIVYVDGIAVFTTTKTNVMSATHDGATMTIGGFDGTVQGLMLWPHALTADSVRYLVSFRPGGGSDPSDVASGLRGPFYGALPPPVVPTYIIKMKSDTVSNNGQDLFSMSRTTADACEAWCDSRADCTGFDFKRKSICWFTNGDWGKAGFSDNADVDFYGKNSVGTPQVTPPTALHEYSIKASSDTDSNSDGALFILRTTTITTCKTWCDGRSDCRGFDFSSDTYWFTTGDWRNGAFHANPNVDFYGN